MMKKIINLAIFALFVAFILAITFFLPSFVVDAIIILLMMTILILIVDKTDGYGKSN